MKLAALLFIFVLVACTNARYARLGMSQFITGSFPQAATSPSGPWLIVSNDPEDQEAPITGPVTLYRGSATFSSLQRFRLFL